MSNKSSKPAKKSFLNLFTWILRIAFIMFLLGVAGAVAGYFYLARDLPPLHSLRSYRPPVISKVYADDGTLIAEFAKQKRRLVAEEDIPEYVKYAFVAAEDKRFYQHEGVDFKGILRAFVRNVQRGRLSEGASTISMQVARTFFLTQEKSFQRKLKEAILALRIERSLKKDEILYLYLNQVHLGKGYHGIGSAARYFFDKPVKELTMAEGAMLAGVLPAPNRYNPVANFDLAKLKQKLVLKAMQEAIEDGNLVSGKKQVKELKEKIEKAHEEKIKVYAEKGPRGEAAPYFVEHVRKTLGERYGWDKVYKGGLKVFTTVNLEADRAASKALRSGILGPGGLDNNIGFRTEEIPNLSPEQVQKTQKEQEQKLAKKWKRDLTREYLAQGKGRPSFYQEEINPQDLEGAGAIVAPAPFGDIVMVPDPMPLEIGNQYAAIVAKVDDAKDEVWVLIGHSRARINGKDMKWAGPYREGREPEELEDPSQILSPGDQIKVKIMEKKKDSDGDPYYRASLRQEPVIQGGVFSMSSRTGHVKALCGGLDFEKSEFIRPIQAKRQPGSAFKPVVYSTALDTRKPNGEPKYTMATMLIDTPMVFDKGSSSCDVVINEPYRPKNYNQRFTGPHTFQRALALSINTIAVRICWDICISNVIERAHKLGIQSRLDKLPCLPLGCSEVTLEELSTAYNVFASGGKKVRPVYITRVYDRDGNLLEYEKRPEEYKQSTSAQMNTKNPEKGFTEENLTAGSATTSHSRPTHYLLSKPVPPGQLGEPGWKEYLEKIKSEDHRWLAPANTPAAGKQVITPQTAYLTTYLLRNVVREGTATSANRLKHKLAGKTGTTNNYRDALFLGYSPELLAGVWVGADKYEYSLGKGMSGAKAALPIWMNYMKEVLKNRKVVDFSVPPGIEWVKIDLDTGLRKSEYTERWKTYPFLKGTAPEKESPPSVDFPENYDKDDRDDNKPRPGMDASMVLDN
ncbi:MAG: transglycosylase domain-containing protein [bacterium]